MSNIPRFVAYAAAFEQAVESDDWSSLEPFFTEDVVYEVGLPLLGRARCEGRDELFGWFKQVLDDFDRRFESRTLKLLDGPSETDAGEVSIHGSAIYRAEGAPEFVLTLVETVRFEGDRISYLEDRYSDEMKKECEAYLRAHGKQLGIDLVLEDGEA